MLDYNQGKLFEFNKSFVDNPFKSGFINLYQIGEVGLENGGKIFEHIQFCHEISYIVSGEGVFYTGETMIPVSQGDIHVISKGTPHKIISNSPQRLRYIYMGFDFGGYAPEFEDMVRFYSNSPVTTTCDIGEVRFLLNMLINEFYYKPSLCNVIVKTSIEQVLIFVYRLFSSYKPKYFSPGENENAIGQTAYIIMRYIDSNIFDIKNIKSIADKLGYSESYISHLFKEKTNITIQEYVRIKKIEASIELLKSEKYTVTEIARHLNYDTPQSFCKVFKKYTSLTPTEYKQTSKTAL